MCQLLTGHRKITVLMSCTLYISAVSGSRTTWAIPRSIPVNSCCRICHANPRATSLWLWRQKAYDIVLGLSRLWRPWFAGSKNISVIQFQVSLSAGLWPWKYTAYRSLPLSVVCYCLCYLLCLLVEWQIETITIGCGCAVLWELIVESLMSIQCVVL